MSTLEQAITEAARQGRLDGLTLWPTTDGRYQGNHKIGSGWQVHIADDPVTALLGALGVSGLTNDKDGEDVFG